MSDDKKLIELAGFERKTQLRRVWAKGAKKITPLQQTWTRYMLMNWGAKYRGKEGPASSAGNIIGRMMWCNEWNSDQGERIKVIFTNLLNQGYMGNDLIRKVKEIFLPNSSGSSAISLAKEQDDAEFVEKIINKTLSTRSPLREVVIRHYLYCKVPQVISEELTELTGMELESSRRRVRWTENAAEDLLFAAMQIEMENEKLQMAA